MKLGSLLTPVVRISLGLVFLTVSLLLAADIVGLVPRGDDDQFSHRKQLAESLAAMFSASLTRDDIPAIEATMDLLVERNPDIESMGLREANGSTKAAAGDHDKHWRSTDGKSGGERQWAVPLFGSGERWGDVEVVFAQKEVPQLFGYRIGPMALLLAFVSAAGFFVFRLFMRRTLRHLDPSSVVPRQVQTALDVLAEGVAIFDSQRHIVLANEAFARKIGAETVDILGRTIEEIGWVRRAGAEELTPWPWDECIEDGGLRTGVRMEIDTAEKARTFLVNAAPVLDHGANVCGALATFDDVTVLEDTNVELQQMVNQLTRTGKEIQEKNERLEYLATHDPLTDCLNRRSFFRTMEAAFEESYTQRLPLACIMTDIDHFKSFNDRFGHLVGDEVIQRVAKALGSTLGENDRLCRYGGEEFCILLPGMPIEEAAKAAERLRLIVHDNDDGDLTVSCSFGVSAMGLGADTAAELIDQADRALYVSKRQGRNRVTRWEEGLEQVETEQAPAEAEVTETQVLDIPGQDDEDFGRTSTHIEQHLYHIEEENRWYQLAIELLSSLGEMHRHGGTNDFRTRIFETAINHLRRLIQFDATCFAMIDPESGNVLIQAANPSRCAFGMQELATRLESRGNLSIALGESGPVELRLDDEGHTVLVHVVPSQSSPHCFFLGRLPENSDSPRYAACSLLSIVLQSTASALDNAELYRVVNVQNAELENRLEARTRELEHHQLHDGLTGLPNRSLLRDRLQTAIALACRSKNSVAMLVLDIDTLKRINNTLGHSAGDALLTEVSTRLLDVLRGSDTIARLASGVLPTVSRLGGDEFGIVLSELKDIRGVRGVVSRIIERLGEGFTVEDRNLHITCSVGVSMYPNDGDSPDVLLRKAESAMFHAKRKRRNDYHFYTTDMNAGAIRYMELESHLRSAIVNNELEVLYQPKVELSAGRVVGVEALLRWHSAVLGSVSPAEFIPVAESAGLIPAIGEWVLRGACKQSRRWREAGFPDLPIAVNLSPLQLRREELRERIFGILEEYAVQPSSIEFEITETVLIEHMDTAITLLRNLADAGARVAVDDFGTGYSSLGHLKRFPIHTLKIDRMFITDLASDSNDVAIVGAITEMSRAMGMQVVAEGVETREQLAILRAHNCDMMQGFLFSPAVSSDEITDMLLNDTRLPIDPLWMPSPVKQGQLMDSSDLN